MRLSKKIERENLIDTNN